MIHLVENALLDQGGKRKEIHDHSRLGIDFPHHGDPKQVVMPMPMRIGAGTEDLQVAFLGPLLACEAMCSTEFNLVLEFHQDGDSMAGQGDPKPGF